ncbi:Lipoyl synthase [Streptomyces misionensis JCM 4497]
MDQDPGENGPRVHQDAEPREERGPAHGLPGSRLPQHLRVLGGPRGDLPHRRRPVHPALRLLPDRHRQARGAGPRRAPPRRRVRGHHGPQLRHHHRCRPRRPGGRRRLAVRRDGAPDPPADGRPRGRPHQGRTAGPGLQRGPGAAGRGLRVPPRGLRAQRGDRAPDLQADPPRLPLRALPEGDHRGPRLRPGHQVQPDPRHGRDPRGDQRGAAAAARGRLRADHHHPVPAPLRAPPPGGALGQAAGVRGAEGGGRADRLLRCDVRPAGALLVPRRPPVPDGDREAGQLRRRPGGVSGTRFRACEFAHK